MRVFKSTDPTPSGAMERHWIYNGLDCCITAEVLAAIRPQLDETTSLTYSFSRALQGPVLDMSTRGTLVDSWTKEQKISDLSKKADKIKAAFDRLVVEGIGIPGGVSISSPVQLAKLFYDVMNVPAVKNYEGGRTCNEAALEKIKQYYYAEPLVNHILGYRELVKRIGTLKAGVDNDSRMRFSFGIASTVTGRFSSYKNPFGSGTNSQNLDPEIRSIFIADPGKKLAYIDLEQAESRVVGAICWNLFHSGVYLDACESSDLHTVVAKMVWPELGWRGDPPADKKIAEQLFHRHFSYRDATKRLGHGCLTADHEVLTPEGWVPITDKSDTILTWDGTASRFSPVNNWTDYEHTGELISFEGNSISATMTPEHRVPYRSSGEKSSRILTRTAANGPGIQMPLGFGYVGGNEIVPARLIAAFMSDGNRQGNKSRFHFRKKRKIERLEQLCETHGYSYTTYVNPDETVNISVDAIFPKRAGSYMLNWSRASLLEFLDEYKYWDGHQGRTAVTLFSIDREHLEWIQTLGRICGIGGQIQKPYISGFGSVVFHLQQNNRRWASGSSIKTSKKIVERERVLCPTVQSGWFYARRNGKAFITGNSNYLGTPFTMSQFTKIPIALCRDFQERYFTAFPELKAWHLDVKQRVLRDGWIVSLMGRRRWFMGRRWDDSTIREAVAYNPQSSVADILNSGLLNLWRANLQSVDLLMQVHDAVLIQYDEAREDELLPQCMKLIELEVPLFYGRTLRIPSEAKTGWNWGYHSDKNPDGIKTYRATDDRKRQLDPKTHFMDRVIR